MAILVNVLLVIDKVHITLQRLLEGDQANRWDKLGCRLV